MVLQTLSDGSASLGNGTGNTVEYRLITAELKQLICSNLLSQDASGWGKSAWTEKDDCIFGYRSLVQVTNKLLSPD